MKCKFIYRLLLPVLFLFVIASCEEEEEIEIPQTTFSYDEVAPQSVSPTHIFEIPDYVAAPQQLLVGDGRIYLSNRPGQPGVPTLFVFDAETGEEIGYMGQRRHGPGDLVSISVLALRPGQQPRVSAFDPTQMVLSFLRSNASEENLRDGARMAELELSEVPDDLALLEDGRIWAGGVWTEPYRVIELSNEGGFRQRLIQTPEYEFGRSPQVFNEIWESTLAAGGEEEVVALAARYAARIDLYSPEAEPILRIDGPDSGTPAYRHPEDNRSEFEFADEAIYGYLDVTAFDEGIAGLYSGKSYHEDDGEYGRYLHLFDSEGNIRQVLELDRRISSISIDGREGVIFGLTDDRHMVAYDIGEGPG